MILWFKFDSNRLNIESATNRSILTKGFPVILPKNKGMFNNWGCVFKKNIYFEVPGHGLQLPKEITVSFWTVWPLNGNDHFHILL
jgi:hypothetical protein